MKNMDFDLTYFTKEQLNTLGIKTIMVISESTFEPKIIINHLNSNLENLSLTITEYNNYLKKLKIQIRQNKISKILSDK